MRITKLSWTNYKGLTNDEIVADGADVIVRGQNGAGKSSIAELVSFILFGKFEGKTIKSYEDGRTNHDDGLTHGAEVTFDNGITFSRYAGKTGYRYFINGQSKSAAEFNAEVNKMTNKGVEVNKMTNKGVEVVFNPFCFHDDIAWSEQRDLLVEIFGDVKEHDELTPDEAALLNGLTADKFIEATKKKLTKAQKRIAAIPSNIKEIETLLARIPSNLPEEITRLETQAAQIKAEIATFQTERDNLNQPAATNAKAEYEMLMRQADQLKSEIERNQRDRNRTNNQLQNIFAEYRKARDSKPGICPACQQKIPYAKFVDAQKAKLEELKSVGNPLKVEIQNLDAAIEKGNGELFKLGKRAGELSKAAQEQSANEADRLESLAKIKRTIAEREQALDNLRNTLASHKAAIKSAADYRKRIEELNAELKQLHKDAIYYEGDISKAKFIRRRVAESLEGKINSGFENVKFKMYNVIASTGEMKETCEAFMHDVPYSALSKGEKLKCALETFKVIQSYYGVQMPVILDDAESYTLNSFVALPNQIWLFKVSDDEKLTIKVEKMEATI